MVQVLGLMKVCQVLVVSEDLDREGGTMKIIPLQLQGMDDYEEFMIIDVIILFC